MDVKDYKKLSLKEIHSLLLEIMDEIHRICEIEGIDYYLLYGSALGQARVGGFIPWDDDMDLGMIRPEFERFKEAFYKLGNQEKFFLQLFETDVDYVKPVMRVCMKGTYMPVHSYMRHLKMNKSFYIDIFPLDNIADTEKARRQQIKEILLCQKILDKQFYYFFENNGPLKRLAKRLISFIYNLYPQKKVYDRMQKAMQKYNNVDTKEICALTLCYGEKRETLKRRYLGKPTLRTFEDRYYYFPENIDEYLTHMYGTDYIKVPSRLLVRNTHDVYVENNKKPYVVGFAIIEDSSFTKESSFYLKSASEQCDHLFVGINILGANTNNSGVYEVVNSLSFVYKAVYITKDDIKGTWDSLHYQVVFIHHGDVFPEVLKDNGVVFEII